MAQAKTLYLLRHGDTGAQGRFIGSTDLPVASEGWPQLTLSRDRLQQVGLEKVFCSPMLRCRQSLEHLQLGLTVQEDHNLREIDFGAWEGKTFSEISARWPKEVSDWSIWSEQFCFPDGETIGTFVERIRCLKKKIDECPSNTILVVSHGGVIRSLICLYLGLSPDKYLLFDIKAGCYSTLSLYSEGGVLTSLNNGVLL